ncbi:hypothetical protein CRYUN_Cryun06bG0095000 [Craigia yunnanensis]
MKMMKGEVVLNIPAEKAWEMYRNNEIISKINPETLSGAEYIQGDGSPGSLRLFKLGPGVLKEMYDVYMVTFSFIPMEGEENEKCIAEWKAEFEALAPATPPPEKARDAALGFLKSFDSFQLSY